MSEHLRYDGRVAIITGAGGGLGRAYALLLGARGAKVLVNDLGGSAQGDGRSSAAADKVVDEIKELGGEAVANHDSVEDGDKIVQGALDTFGGIDIVINNAGILRDVSFLKMSAQDWDLIYRVHALGSYRVTHAAWPHLRDKGYGRVIVTASAAGLYGNFGQANYSMAKMGLVGFGRTLALEGAAKNIHVNVIAPIAGSRLLETVLSPEVIAALKPDYVAALVAYLCHEKTTENGGIFEVGGGLISKLRWERTEGHHFRGRAYTPEEVASHWAKIGDFSRSTHPASIAESAAPVFDAIGQPSRGGNEFIDVDAALAAELAPIESRYDERDVALYALGVGAAQDPLDARELPLVYELNGDGFHVLPTWGVMPVTNALLKMAQEGSSIPGLNFGFERMLHGEQYTQIQRPLPPNARLRHRVKIKNVYDKGKNALIVMAFTSTDADTGEELIYNELGLIARGVGGWGGERGPGNEDDAAPERAPDAVMEETVPLNQALLYRLSGDWNPLHVDAAFARAFGFDKPILHGLCTFGYVGRHVIGAFCNNDPRTFSSIKVRFADSVFPGETLQTQMWKLSDTRIVFRCKVKQRDTVVISHGVIQLHAQIPQLRPIADAPKAEEAKKASAGITNEPASADLFAAIGSYVEQHPELAGKVGTLFQWKLSDPSSTWILDLKNGPGSCTPGVVDKADCTLELADADFLAMATGKSDPQKLYFGGKLKISGNVMASQKLEFLKKIDPQSVRDAAQRRAPPPAIVAPAPVTAMASAPSHSAVIFAMLAQRLDDGSAQVDDVDALLQFDVRAPERHWIVDLRRGRTQVREGRMADAAAVFTLDDADLVALADDPAQAQRLFQHGRLRVDGDVRLAHRLGFLQGLSRAELVECSESAESRE